MILRLSVLLALAGCLPHARTEQPTPDYALPERFSEPETPEGSRSNATVDGRWWLHYDDPTLHSLVERSLTANVSVRARYAAIEQAQAIALSAAAQRYPTISATGSVGYNRSVGFFGTNNSYQAQAQLPIQWEIDLFARWRGQAEAANVEVEASRLDAEALALATSAQVADAWYGIVEAQARRALLAEQHRINETYLELVRLRFEQGLSSAVDVHQQRQQVALSRSRLELLDGEVELLRQQLSVLLGLPPSELGGLPESTSLPDLGPAPAPGVPASVVWGRPDVRAAQARVRAADWRIGSAIAARLPSIRLNVTPGYSWQRNEIQGSALGMGRPSSVDGFTFNAGATLNVPLFDGFVGRAQVVQQEAALQIQVEQLSQAVLTALVEVEGAIVREAQQRRNVVLLEERAQIANDTLESARDRYRAGLSDFLPVLTALQAEQAAQLDLLTARRQLVAQRIALHRALGGTWPSELETPPPTPMREGDVREGEDEAVDEAEER